MLHTIDISYNQPKLPRCSQWDPYAITFAEEMTLGSYPLGVFVDKRDIVYVNSELTKEIHIWNLNSNTSTIIIAINRVFFYSLFVTVSEDIYISNSVSLAVEKWSQNATEGIIVVHDFVCYGLFVDISNHLYCSLYTGNQVAKKSLNDGSSMGIIVAGNGTAGIASNMLDGPYGMFVTISCDLYVADSWNHRVQLFKPHQLDGITVAGDISTSTMKLYRPVAVFFDADDYLYIVDAGHNRIIRSRSNIFYCIVGCSAVPGSAPHQLYFPVAAAFDTHGNIFVADYYNSRIQKFILLTNTSSKSTLLNISLKKSIDVKSNPSLKVTRSM